MPVGDTTGIAAGGEAVDAGSVTPIVADTGVCQMLQLLDIDALGR
jgi:hypothetical protein